MHDHPKRRAAATQRTEKKKMPTMEEFRIALRDLGWGDSYSAQVLFLGIDNGYGVTEPDELVESHVGPPVIEPGNAENTQVTANIARIVTTLQNPGHPPDWRDYRTSRLFTRGSEAFLAYMFPIGRTTQDEWPREYKSRFGMSSNDYYDYVLRERPGRLGQIDDLRFQGRFRLLIFFGMGERTRNYWKAFVNGFRLEDEVFIGISDSVRVYLKQRVVMLPPLTNTSMTQKRRDQAIRLIIDNGINPFNDKSKNRRQTKAYKSTASRRNIIPKKN